MSIDQSGSSLLNMVRRIPPERTIAIEGTLNALSEKRLSERLAKIQESAGSEILVTINSKGGSFVTGINLHHTFRSIHGRTVGKVDGFAMSAAFMALQGCEVRYATPSSRLWIHNPQIQPNVMQITHNTRQDEFLADAKTQFDLALSTIQQQREEVVQALLSRSSVLNRSQLEEILEKRPVLTPKQAVRYGFLDGII